MKLLKLLPFFILFISADQKHPAKRKIIDVHFHTRYAKDYGPTPPPNAVTSKIPPYKTDDEVVQLMVSTLKENGVVKAIASGPLARTSDFQKKDNSLIVPSFEYPDKINNSLPDTASFAQMIREKKFFAFGELALQYEGKLLTDPEFEPYLSICERMEIPVGLHTGLGAPNSPYTCCPGFRTKLGNPQLIEEVLIRHPKLKIQLMHMGYPYLEETKAIMYMYPQVYADISVVNWILPVATFHDYLKSLIDAGFGKKLMYGSDEMAWDDAIPLSIKNVESASFLSEQQKQDIFYNNAARFYNIK